jgi:hypothetical protein
MNGIHEVTGSIPVWSTTFSLSLSHVSTPRFRPATVSGCFVATAKI